MTILIGAVLLGMLLFGVYRDFRGPAQQPGHNPVLHRLAGDFDAQSDPAGEAREVELAHQLITEGIDSATYCREMSELTHTSAVSAAKHPTTEADRAPGTSRARRATRRAETEPRNTQT